MDLFEEKFLTSGVASVTTIRDPETTFRSVYNYYYLNHAGKGIFNFSDDKIIL